MRPRLPSILFLLLCTFTCLGCDREKEPGPAAEQKPASPAVQSTELPTLTLPPDSGAPAGFDGDRAMQYVKDIVKFGPRPLGSANHKL